MDDRIVTFESYSDTMLAEIIKGRLEANGIECFIADENTIGANPLFNNAIGGVKIKVFERDVEKCKAILAQDDELKADELTEEQTETCPYCNSTNVKYGPMIFPKTSWLSSFRNWFSVNLPFYARQSWHCFNCGKNFN